MTRGLTRALLLAFRDRRWSRARGSKELFWATDTQTRGAMAGLLAGAALWEYTRHIDPGWPSNPERQADLEHHAEVSEKLKRIAHVFARS